MNGGFHSFKAEDPDVDCCPVGLSPAVLGDRRLSPSEDHTGEAQHLTRCCPKVWGEHEKSPEQRQPAKDRSARWSRRE